MIDLETPRQIDDRQKGPKRVLVAGLLAAAAVVGIILMSSRDANDSTPTDEPSPTVTVPSTVTVTVPPTVTGTVPPTTPPRALFGTPYGSHGPGTYFVDEVDGIPTPRIFVTSAPVEPRSARSGLGRVCSSMRTASAVSSGSAGPLPCSRTPATGAMVSPGVLWQPSMVSSPRSVSSRDGPR